MVGGKGGDGGGSETSYKQNLMKKRFQFVTLLFILNSVEGDHETFIEQ